MLKSSRRQRRINVRSALVLTSRRIATNQKTYAALNLVKKTKASYDKATSQYSFVMKAVAEKPEWQCLVNVPQYPKTQEDYEELSREMPQIFNEFVMDTTALKQNYNEDELLRKLTSIPIQMDPNIERLVSSIKRLQNMQTASVC